MTGFRVARGGAQERFGIEPDLTTMGKVIGGGLPVGAYGGRRELLELIAPAGPIYQAGTLSGNPLAMAAGLAQLRVLDETDPYDALEHRSRQLVDAILDEARALGLPATGAAYGGMWGVHFVEGPVRSFEDARKADTALFGRFSGGAAPGRVRRVRGVLPLDRSHGRRHRVHGGGPRRAREAAG